MKKVKKKKRIRFKRVFILIVIFIIIGYIIKSLFSLPVSNIIIKGNTYLSDQEIIDLSGLSNYPSIIENSSKQIASKLEKNIYISSAKVSKNVHREVTIEISENKPLFYNLSKKKTVLMNGKDIDEMLEVPVLINYVPDTIYNDFINSMSKTEYSILKKISEIKYDPSNVDKKRFLLYMSDKNKVYVTLDKFSKVNNYNDIIEKVLVKYDDKKGTLYLDEGEYFVLN